MTMESRIRLKIEWKPYMYHKSDYIYRNIPKEIEDKNKGLHL